MKVFITITIFVIISISNIIGVYHPSPNDKSVSINVEFKCLNGRSNSEKVFVELKRKDDMVEKTTKNCNNKHDFVKKPLPNNLSYRDMVVNVTYLNNPPKTILRNVLDNCTSIDGWEITDNNKTVICFFE